MLLELFLIFGALSLAKFKNIDCFNFLFKFSKLCRIIEDFMCLITCVVDAFLKIKDVLFLANRNFST